MIVLDDHLVRDFAANELAEPIAAQSDLATTNLWLFRLAGALENAGGGSLSKRTVGLSVDEFSRFRHELGERLTSLTIVPMQLIVWSMAEFQARHRREGRGLSAVTAEALAAAQYLGADIAVSAIDVGPALQAAAESDGVGFQVIEPSAGT